MAAYLSPVGNEQQNDANGAPLSGGFINTYAAGTTTPITTYTDSAGLVPQANPIVLNISGLPANPIWLPAGQAVKLVFQNSAGVQQRPPMDNISGINDPAFASTVDQWVIYTATPTCLSGTSFSVAGDQRNLFQFGRRVRALDSGGYVYGTITSVTFTTVTTVVLAIDILGLSVGLTQVSYGLISQTSNGLPRGPAFSAYQSVAQSIANTTLTKIQFQSEEFDTANAFDAATNYRFQPPVAGYYLFTGMLALPAAASNLLVTLYKNGAEYKRGAQASGVVTFSAVVSSLVLLNGSTEYVELYGYQASGGAVNSQTGQALTYFQGVFVRGM